MGATYVTVVNRKEGAVDDKLRDLGRQFMQGHRDDAAQWLVVIISGDSDFGGEIRALRAEGFRTMIMHGAGRLSPGYTENAELCSGEWDAIVRSAIVESSTAFPLPGVDGAGRGGGGGGGRGRGRGGDRAWGVGHGRARGRAGGSPPSGASGGFGDGGPGSRHDTVCFTNMGCYNPECSFRHSTSNGFSPKHSSNAAASSGLPPRTIPPVVAKNITQMLRDAGSSMLGTHVVPQYLSTFGRKLDYGRLGFKKLRDLMVEIPSVVEVPNPSGVGDVTFRLKASRRSPPVPSPPAPAAPAPAPSRLPPNVVRDLTEMLREMGHLTSDALVADYRRRFGGRVLSPAEYGCASIRELMEEVPGCIVHPPSRGSPACRFELRSTPPHGTPTLGARQAVVELPGRTSSEKFSAKLWVDKFGLDRLRRAVAKVHMDSDLGPGDFRAHTPRKPPPFVLILESPSGKSDLLETARAEAERLLGQLHRIPLWLKGVPRDLEARLGRDWLNEHEVLLFDDGEAAAGAGNWCGEILGSERAAAEALRRAKALENQTVHVPIATLEEGGRLKSAAFVASCHRWLAQAAKRQFDVTLVRREAGIDVKGASPLASRNAAKWLRREIELHIERRIDVPMKYPGNRLRRLFKALRRRAKEITRAAGRTPAAAESSSSDEGDSAGTDDDVREGEGAGDILLIHVQAQDDEGVQLKPIFDEAERRRQKPSPHGAIVSMHVEMVAPRSSAAALDQAAREIESLVEHYEEDTCTLSGADSLCAKFQSNAVAATRKFMHEHGLTQVDWDDGTKVLFYTGARDAVRAATNTLNALVSDARRSQRKVACPVWFWRAMRSDPYYPAIDALRDRLKEHGVAVTYDSLVPKREPGVLASLIGQTGAIEAGCEEVERFLRRQRAGFVEEVLETPFGSAAIYSFFARRELLLQRTVDGSGCGYELVGPQPGAGGPRAATPLAPPLLPAGSPPKTVQRAAIRAPGVEDLELLVQLGDMLSSGCDAVVNPANSRLEHGSGAARAIWEQAGREYDAECSRALADAGLRRGDLVEGRALRTSGCQLQANRGIAHVIHAVGRSWTPGGDNHASKRLLRSAVKAALTEAAGAGVKALAIPLMGTGVWRWPREEASRELVWAISHWASEPAARRRGGGTLRRVVLIDLDARAVSALQLAMRNQAEQAPGLATTTQEEDGAGEGGGEGSGGGGDVLRVDQLQWAWQNDAGGFTPYDADQNVQLERGWFDWKRDGGTGSVLLTGDLNGVLSDSKFKPAGKAGAEYEVTFSEMLQRNTVSRFKRKVVRGMPGAAPLPPLCILKGPGDAAAHLRARQSPASVAIVDDQGEAILGRASGLVGDARVVKLHGAAADVAEARAELQRVLSEHTHASATPIERSEPSVPMDFILQRVRPRAAAMGVDLVEQETAFTVRALGEELLVQAETKLEREVVIAEREFRNMRMEPPDTWIPMPDGASVHTVEVHRETQEWADVEARLNSHGFGATVAKIRRVQHPRRWEKFAFQRDLIAREICGAEDAAHDVSAAANELWLKHGTGKMSAEEVATSDTGIDPIFCDRGLYGRGSYFAEEASYTHDCRFASAAGDGQKEMLLVRVLAGRVDERRTSDTSIRLPKPGMHSIKGTLHTSQQAYVVYEAHRSYPEYIVTYKK